MPVSTNTLAAAAYKAAMESSIGVIQSRNMVTLYVKDGAALKNLLTGTGGNKTHVLKIGSPDLVKPDSRSTPYTFDFKLTVTGKEMSISIAKKSGKVDIANPASAMTVTLGAKNTSPDIAQVDLLTKADDAAPASEDFRVVSVSGKTFKIGAAHGEVVPGVAQNVFAKMTLVSGKTFFTKKIAITPSQTKSKATQSTKGVTLYKMDPLRGQTVGVGLKTPTNVKLGDVDKRGRTLCPNY